MNHSNPEHHQSNPNRTSGSSEQRESTAEHSQQRLERLLETAETVFTGVSDRLLTIGDTHLQRHEEVVARGEVRRHSLDVLRSAVNGYIDEGVMDRAAHDRLQELEHQARTGNRLVVGQTEYLYNPESASNTASTLAQDRSRLEQDAREYVADEPANQENLPDSFFEGLKNISEAVSVLDEMSEQLGSMYVHDNHLQEAFSDLRQKLNYMPLQYDSDMMHSLLRSVNDVIECASDADRSRDRVHKVADELRQTAAALANRAHR